MLTICEYGRVSTDKQETTLQAEEFDKFEKRFKEDNQEEVIFIRYLEDGISGKNIERPKLKEMLNLVYKNKVNKIVITKLDRLGRNLRDLLNIVNDIKNYKVDLIVLKENIDTSTPQGILLFHMLGAFAEFERTVIMERMNAGRKKAEILGSKSGKPTHRPKIDIDEDGVVKKFENKLSMHQIAKNYKVSITPIRRILKSRGLI